ncbi:hypothetical protein KKC45_00190 [Patescibacteria group bacterium]|nr:hypothetical protein [Patescibacteria group bacterium]
MSVEFNELQRQSYSNFDNPPKMVSWVIEHSGGLIKDQKQAQYFLLGFAVFCCLLSGIIFFTGDNDKDNFDDGLTENQREMILLEELEMQR